MTWDVLVAFLRVVCEYLAEYYWTNIYEKASRHERDMNFFHLSLEMILALNFVEWTSRALEAEDQTLPRKLKTTS